jgi:hypothetical protein
MIVQNLQALQVTESRAGGGCWEKPGAASSFQPKDELFREEECERQRKGEEI